MQINKHFLNTHYVNLWRNGSHEAREMINGPLKSLKIYLSYSMSKASESLQKKPCHISEALAHETLNQRSVSQNLLILIMSQCQTNSLVLQVIMNLIIRKMICLFPKEAMEKKNHSFLENKISINLEKQKPIQSLSNM